jgi:GR25 family glycosyltransferase involved in LPS biosynthesis
MVQAGESWIQPVPSVDEFNIPQGLAGNSAYIIKPDGAKDILSAAREHGLWPNDALMCKQLVPKLGVTKTYFTRVQGLPSTTVN